MTNASRPAASRLYILIGNPFADSGEVCPPWGDEDDSNVIAVYPRFTFARSKRRAVNRFRHILGPDICTRDVLHVPPSQMTPRDREMLAIFAPRHPVTRSHASLPARVAA